MRGLVVLRRLWAAMLFYAVAAWGPAQAAFGSCDDPVYRARFDPRLAGASLDCIERLRISVPAAPGGATIRLIQDASADWAILPGVVAALQRGIEGAVAAFQAIGDFRLNDVTVLLVDDLPPREGSSEIFGPIAGGAWGARPCRAVRRWHSNPQRG